MSDEKYTKIDGNSFYNAFAKGAEKVVEKRTLLDKINVFPVADSDTGKNMAQTLRSVAEQTTPNSSVGVVSNNMAQVALTNSRGNSGIIFAQFINGISEAVGEREHLRLSEFAQVMKKASSHAYEATNEPVEGTILTVMREWSQSLHDFVQAKRDLLSSLDYSLQTAQQSLRETKEKLHELKEAGVVDAGAKGFVLFLEGIAFFFKTGQTAEFSSVEKIEEEHAPHVDNNQQMVGPRYCTEAVLSGKDLEGEQLKDLASNFGESLIVAGGSGKYRVHIHTDDPAQLFYHFQGAGTVLDQKVDDMRKQYEAVYDRNTDVALVTDSTCDLPDEIMDRYQVYRVPLTVSFGDNRFLDKVTITPSQFYQMLSELGKGDEFPTSSQPSVGQFEDTYSFLLENYDSIVSIHIADALSGTWKSANEAAKNVDEDRITVIDSRQLSTSLGLVVGEAAKVVDAGASRQEVADFVTTLRTKAKILVSLKTLKYMVRGGRISPVSGFLGRLLNFKPIISLDENGDSELHGRPLRRKTNFHQILDFLKNPHTGTNVSSYAIGHVKADKEAKRLQTMIEKELGMKPDYTMDISPLIGSHAGIGAVSVSYITE